MVLQDFIFGDKKLSDYNGMIGYMETSPSSTVNMGSELTYDYYNNNSTWKNKILVAKYETPIEFTIDIFKSDCGGDKQYFSESEISSIMRWLNQKEWNKFFPVYDDDTFPNIYYEGSFPTITAIWQNGRVIGFTLVFQCSSPFGYIDNSYSLYVQPEIPITLYNQSDEIGFATPIFEIEILADGDLEITNSLEPNKMVINNCSLGEIITLDSEHLVITTSDDDHSKIYNDFNYNYIKLWSLEKTNKNVLTFSLPCNVKINYQIIKKVGVMV